MNLKCIEETLCKLTSKYSNAKFLLTGDFNRMPLDGLCAQFKLNKCVGFFTYQNSILDQILTDIDEYPSAVKLPPLVGNENDHCGIYLGSIFVRKRHYTVVTKRVITPASRQSVLIDIAKQDWKDVLSAPCADTKTDALNQIIVTILDNHCPLKKFKTRADKPNYITPAIDKIRKARDRAYNKNYKTWKFFSNLSKKMLARRKRDYVNNKLNAAITSKAWWKSVKAVEGRLPDQPSEYHLIDGQWVNTSQLVELLNDYFINVGGTRDLTQIPDIGAENLEPISIGEVKALLRTINTSKCTNSDDWPAWVSKASHEDLCIPVADIFNCMLATNHYPNVWKSAEIRPLKKVKNPETPKDYRPISLLHHLGKLGESVILQRLKMKIEAKLRKNQFAYQQSLSTTDALTSIIHDWCVELDSLNTSHVTAVLIDMSKAFDKMDPNKLLIKLKSLGTNDGLLNLINDFLTDRECCVKMGEKSEYKPITMGAPQGTRLGPWLWLAYIDDLTADFKMVKYADDVTLYAPFKKTSRSTQDFQTSLDNISSWAETNNMIINAQKTQQIQVTLSEPKYETVLQMNGVIVNTTDTVKLLGITIDQRLTFSEHVDNLCEAMETRLYGMRSLKRLGLNKTGLVRYYTTNIRTALTYACQAWTPLLSDILTNKIIQVERKALRVIYPDLSYTDAITECAIPSLAIFVQKQCIHYVGKIFNNPNHPLNHLITKNTGRSTRVSRATRMPRCRTSKLKSSFFYQYSNFL